jgi:FAD/FMN-containing dehydrogenase
VSANVSRPFSRRGFLAGSSALGLAAGLTATGFDKRAYAQSAAACQPYWRSLACELDGPLLLPGDTRFRRFAEPFNLAFDTPDRQPNAIALCANANDVAAAITWAAAQNVSPVVRSGGHSYAGYSMGPGLMIDVSLLKSFSWDGSRRRVTIGSGARNGDLYNVLRAENRTVTHGRCPTVGVAGFLLGGGIGFNMRSYGVASDLLKATAIVTADGEQRQVAETSNADQDLFWASRGGGGGNFGINTSFTLDTIEARGVTVFSLQWHAARDDAKHIAFKVMQALDAVDNRLGSRFNFFRDESDPRQEADRNAIVDILGQFQGSEREARTALRQVLSLNPTKSQIKETSYWDGQDFLIDWDGPLRFTERSVFIPQNLDDAAISTAFDLLWQYKASSNPNFVADVRFFQTGGAMNKPHPEDTAFVHRNSRWLMDFGLAWTAEDLKDPNWLPGNRLLQDQLFTTLSRYGTGSYQNFIDPALKDWAQAYYGINLPRLRKIKRQYDPKNMFAFPQSIPPAA